MSENPVRDAIQDAINEHEVILFMKGTPERPMCGFSARTTAAYSVPRASSAAAVRAEKPHMGRSGVPFMKRMISWPAIASWIAARTGFSLTGSLRSRLEGKGMDGAADLGPEDRVDTAVLLDAAQAREVRGDDGGTEVVAAAGEVSHVGAGAGYGGLDALLELVRRRHRGQPSGRYTS